MAGTTTAKCSVRDSRFGLFEIMCKIRSSGRWLDGSERRLRERKSVLKIGEDHLNGT